MSEPTPDPVWTPVPPPAPTSQTPDQQPTAPQAQPPAGEGATPQGPPPKGKRPFRGDKPKQDRPKLDFTELRTNVRLHDLDKDIESDLATAMAGFETEIQQETEAAKQQAMQ